MTSIILKEENFSNQLTPESTPLRKKSRHRFKKYGAQKIAKNRGRKDIYKIDEEFVRNLPRDKVKAMYYRLYLLEWE